MSYLELPRIVFSGRYQADVSTVNNEVRHYDNEYWEDRFQKPQSGQELNGWWNPSGSGAFRIIGAKVTRAEGPVGGGGVDPLVGVAVAANTDRAPAKLVDLDPQFQFGSMIWGLQIVIGDGSTEYLRGDYAPSPFRDLCFFRIGRRPGSGNASAKFTSVLNNIVWGEASAESPALLALRAAAEANGGRLSISLTTIGYDSNSNSNDFTLGLLVGAIGPWREGEPLFFPAGRRFAPVDAPPVQGSRLFGLNYCDARTGDGRVTLDLANAIPLKDRRGQVADIGPLSLALLREPDSVTGSSPNIELAPGIPQNAQVTPDLYVPLGEIPYRDPDWLVTTGGIVSFPLPEEGDVPIGERPLALIASSPAGQIVALRETTAGWFVRADAWEHRVDSLETPQQIAVDIHARRFGAPFEGAPIQVSLDPRQSGGGTGGSEPNPPKAPVPDINFPAAAIGLDSGGDYGTTAAGIATVGISVENPGSPREYVEGQIYTLTYGFAAQGSAPLPAIDQIVLHVREAYSAPGSPQWADVEPILTQFANLYPVMSRRMFDFSDMATAAEKAKILRFALNLPIEDPNHMPVTRDLSEGKRRMITAWLGKFAPDDPQPEAAPAAERLAAVLGPAPVEAYPEAPVGDNFRIGQLLAHQRNKGMATERIEAEQEAAEAAPARGPAARED